MAAIAAGVRSLGYSKIKQRSSFYSDSDSDSDYDYSFEAPRPRLTNPKTTQPKTTQRSSVSSSRNNNALLSTRVSNTKTTQHSSVSSSSSSRNNDAWPTRYVSIRMYCLGSEKRDQQLVFPRTLEEIKYVGMHLYGAPFVGLFDEEGGEINDPRDVREGDRVVYARQAEELDARVTITCFEKEDVEGRSVLLPRSLEELKKIGAKKYGASFVRVLNDDEAEIDDINMVRDGDRVDFASHKRVEDDEHNWFEDVWRSLLSESIMHFSHVD